MPIKRYLVTGAASGIGAATCELLTKRGVSVVGVDRDRDGLQRLSESGQLTDAIELDLTDLAAISSTLGFLEVDGVANVAGVGPDLGRVDAIFAINLVAPLAVLHAVKPRMRAGAAAVNVASITGEVTDGYLDDRLVRPLDEDFLSRIGQIVTDSADAYRYSKRALLTESVALAVDWAPDIRVNCVSPGITETPMGQRSMAFAWTAKAAGRLPLGRLGDPLEVAQAIAFLLSEESSYITGTSLVVDGGYVARARVQTARR